MNVLSSSPLCYKKESDCTHAVFDEMTGEEIDGVCRTTLPHPPCASSGKARFLPCGIQRAKGQLGVGPEVHSLFNGSLARNDIILLVSFYSLSPLPLLFASPPSLSPTLFIIIILSQTA